MIIDLYKYNIQTKYDAFYFISNELSCYDNVQITINNETYKIKEFKDNELFLENEEKQLRIDAFYLCNLCKSSRAKITGDKKYIK